MTISLIRKTFVAALASAAALLASAPALAKSPLQLSSDVFVERSKVDETGRKAITLVEPKMVLPGDRLVFVLTYRNIGTVEASNFVITNPLPGPVRYNGSPKGLELVSVNEGLNWGVLSKLTVENADGTTRPAGLDDVTDVRWDLKQTLAPGQGGKLVFRAIVR